MFEILTYTTNGDRKPRVEVAFIVNIIALHELVARRKDEDHALAISAVLDTIF